MILNRCHGAKERRSGTALVELAVCLPVLVTVVLGIVEFGRGMMVSELISEASREGARQAIIAGSTNNTITTSVNTFLQNTTVNPQDATVTITITPATGNPNPGNDLAGAHIGDLCKVEVQVPFNSVAYIAGKWLAGKNLVGTCSMRHE